MSSQSCLVRTSSAWVAATTALWVLLAGASFAAPFVPASDADTLERLSTRLGTSTAADPSSRASRAMRTLLARDPGNVDLALRVAQVYLARARSESDPRYLGQAQAVLAPWWSLADPPVPVLLLRATIRQSNHDFGSAQRDLERIVKREPNNAQAWLTLATVQQVSGNLPSARGSCAKLVPLTHKLISTTCMASVDGASGRALQAFTALDAALSESVTAPARDVSLGLGVRAWATTLQAELAERLARPQEADRLYRAGLALDPQDTYSVSAYADFLIDAGRASEVLTLIPATTRVDNLLLRRAIAARITSSPDAFKVANELGQRFAAASARGDRVHLREEARYALIFKGEPEAALVLARENWRVQKEPLDARIALEAAVASKQPSAAHDVLAWLDANPLQGEKIAQLTAQVRAR
jgi:predicted Zn-dependent protease